MSIRSLPAIAIAAHEAGRHSVWAKKWIREARDFKGRGDLSTMKLCVSFARGHMHDHLQAMRRVRLYAGERV